MAVEYDLEIDSKLAPKSILEIFLEIAGADTQVRDLEGARGVVIAGTHAFTMYGKRIPTDECLSCALDFKPEIRIIFRLFYKAEAESAMLQAIISWLRRSEEDAALLYNGEMVILLRKAGQLILNSNADAWSDKYENIGLLDTPYTRQKFEIL